MEIKLSKILFLFVVSLFIYLFFTTLTEYIAAVAIFLLGVLNGHFKNEKEKEVDSNDG